MDNQLNNLIEKIIEKKLKEMQPMTREPAEVVSVDGLKASVRFLNGSEFELLNKSGEVLTAGDSVWVEYRTLPSSGYIAMRNGEAEGLYEPADELVAANVVPKFRTSVLSVSKGEFSAMATAGTHEFKVADIPPASALGGELAVMHIGFKYAAGGAAYKDKIYRFNIKRNGSVLQSRTPVWVGNEAYIQFPPSSEYAMELYVEFDSSVTGNMEFNYDFFRLNSAINSYSEPPSEYEKYADSNNEGAGSIGYSELVKWLQEEITAIKRRLDALGG